MATSASISVGNRWLHSRTGKIAVYSLVTLLTIQGWPLHELSRHYRWRSPISLAWLWPAETILSQWFGQQQVAAHGNAGRIFTISPSCAGPGDMVQITGNGFGALNVQIYVGGQETGHGVITGGHQAQVVSAFGNRATFIVPTSAPPGVSIVWAVNPGDHAGYIAFRVKQNEICGNQTDEDCDGVIDDVDVCTPVNHPPVAQAGADQTHPIGTIIQLDATASSDPDGDLLTFSWTFLHKPSTSNTTLTNASGPTPSFTLDHAGDYTLQVTASDGDLSSADTVVISTKNSAPVAKAGADAGGQIGNTVTLDGSGSSDIDGNSLTYAWTMMEKPASSTATLSDPTSVTPSLTIDAFGDYVVQLVVSDGAADSLADTVTISTLNSPPVANAGPDQSAHVNETVTLDGSQSNDVDGNALTYSWSLMSRPDNSTTSLNNTSSAAPSLTIDRAGTYVAQLVVYDGLTGSQPDTVTISTQNSKPVAHAGNGQSAPVGTQIHLDGSRSSDVDGDALTYSWSLTSKPEKSTALLQNPTSVNPQFTLDVSGIYIVQLIVDDGSVESDPVTVTISTENSKPVANAGTGQSHPIGTTVTLDGTGSSDADGDTLTYEWSLTNKPTESSATLSDPGALQPTFVIDKAGDYTAQLRVHDGTVASDPVTVTITTLNSKPVANAGPDQEKLTGQTVQLTGSGSSDVDGNPLTYFWSFTAVPTGSTSTLSSESIVTPTFISDLPGTYVAQLIVNDNDLDSDPDTVTITVTTPDTTPPAPANLGTITVSPSTNGQVTLTGNATSVEGGATITLTNLRTNQSVTVTATADGSFTTQIEAQTGDDLRLIVTDSAGNTSLPATVTVEPPLPPDPATIAPPVDRTVATTVADSTAFLYTGPNPIQTGVAPGAIEAKRAAVIRGTVLTKDNTPLSGVTITILNHPELGQTLSRADGLFDLAVNGGGLLTVTYTKPGYLPAQRQIEAPWQDYAFLPDVVLIQPDPHVTPIDLTDPAPMQVAAGSSVTDSSGTRQAVVMIPQGTTATLVLPDGTTQPITSLNVRLTEYTVNANGPQTMPGDLPPTSGYTYAVEVSVDEAVAVGATSVHFSVPVPLYVDNFLIFPTGTVVPTGVYDRQQGVWLPQPNGKVLQILSVSDGVAQIDSNGDTVADDAATLAALGITAAEQQQLAQQYPPGRKVWRLLAARTGGFDGNWPLQVPGDAIGPNGPDPGAVGSGDDNVTHLDEPNITGGAVEVQNQTLSQQVALVGAPFTLHYKSDLVAGRTAAYSLTVPLSGATVPASLKRIEAGFAIAGQRMVQTFPPQANLTTSFTWNGRNAYGQQLQGVQSVEVDLKFFYDATYAAPAPSNPAFGETSSMTVPLGIPTRSEFAYGERWAADIGGWNTQAHSGLGGWTLDAHHGYDVMGQVTHFGDGSQRRSKSENSDTLGEGIQTFAGSGSSSRPSNDGDGGPATAAWFSDPYGVAVDAAGNVYITDSIAVRKVAPTGIISTVAGRGSSTAEGVPATSASLLGVRGVAVTPTGVLYLVESGRHRVRKISPNGVITTVAGTGVSGFSGDGGSATAAQLASPDGLALDRAGNLYIADTINNRVRKINVEGRITTVAGTGAIGTNGAGNGLPATQVGLWDPGGVVVDGQGNLFISDRGNDVIRRVQPNGIQHVIVGQYRSTCGGCAGQYNGEGQLGTQTLIGDMYHLALDAEGGLYIADSGNVRVRRWGPDGIVTTVAGSGAPTYSGDGGPATRAGIPFPHGVAIGPEGTLYIATHAGTNTPSDRVRRVKPVLPGFTAIGDIALASKDGSEVYIFNPHGRHLRTVNALTNSVIYSFGYDSGGRLSSVTDANSNVTTITRDTNGNMTGITGPYGQNNTITLDANGYLASLTNPNGETTSFNYTADGLLTSATPPGKPASNFQYDSKGRLTQTSDPAGGGETLTRTNLATGYQVNSTTTGGQSSTYKVEFLSDGQQRRINTMPDGTVETTQFRTDGGQLVTQSDGITQNVSVTGDPRFGLQSPLPTSLAVTTPGGKNGTLTNARTVNLSDPNNPLSLTSQNDTVSFNGRTATRTYNATTRTATETSPAGRLRTTVTDSQGRVSQQQQGTLAPTAFSYDARGRLSSRSQGGRSTSLTYDTLGRPQTITDSANRTVQFQYDSAGRVTQQTLPDNRVIAYSYDGSGNVTSITPPGRPAHSFTYTPVNLEKDYLAPAISGGGTNTTTYSYNADRQVTGITRPDGQQIALSYAGGKLTNQTFPTGAVSYGYNPQGNLSSASFSGGGTVNYTYDGSLLTSSAWSGPVTGSVTWTYDNNYRKTSQSVNGSNTINFGYDNDDLLTSTGAMTLTRDSVNGLLSGTTLGTITDTMTYTSLGEVATAQASIGGTAILAVQYTRDSLGRISTKTETIQGATTSYSYTYDAAGRLSEVKQNGLIVATYTYDSNSNRLSKVGPTGPQSGTYDDQDRLLTYNGSTYSYTANGELASKTSLQPPASSLYTYDALGNLRSATLPNGTTIGYVIDGENRRIGKTVNGSLVQGFLYENQLEPVAELDGNGNLLSRFVYCGCGAGNIPQYMIKGGVTYRIISDHLGSPRLVVDSITGAILQRMDYDEFGNVILDTNPGFQPFGFAGGIYDRDTGLVRHGARDYDPETGRWTAKDPIGFRGLDFNFYGYVFNDPINGLDLDGRLGDFSIGGLSIGGAIRGIASRTNVLKVANILGQIFGAAFIGAKANCDSHPSTLIIGGLITAVLPPDRIFNTLVAQLTLKGITVDSALTIARLGYISGFGSAFVVVGILYFTGGCPFDGGPKK